VGLETAGILESVILLLLAESSHRASFFDIAVAMSLLSAGGGLVFVRFLERWE
jgi:multisubunit Na+/H+ antiporter MnhF subunit